MVERALEKVEEEDPKEQEEEHRHHCHIDNAWQGVDESQNTQFDTFDPCEEPHGSEDPQHLEQLQVLDYLGLLVCEAVYNETSDVGGDDDGVQNVPPISQVAEAAIHHEPVDDDFHGQLDEEDESDEVVQDADHEVLQVLRVRKRILEDHQNGRGNHHDKDEQLKDLMHHNLAESHAELVVLVEEPETGADNGSLFLLLDEPRLRKSFLLVLHFSEEPLPNLCGFTVIRDRCGLITDRTGS